MDERAQNPVTLPRDKPTQPFWQDPPDAELADFRSSEDLPAKVDTLIVGSGITGTSIAWHLLNDPKQPAPSLLMLEARQTTSGATGRNGGHTKAASYLSFLRHAANHGTEAAIQIARLELACIRAVHGLAASEGIACDSRPCPTLDVHYDPAGWELAQKAVAAIKAALPKDDPVAAYTLYSREEAVAQYPCSDDRGSGSTTTPICGVVRYEEAGSIWPYRFVTSLLKKCLAKGLQLQTHTPATALKRLEGDEHTEHPWAVETPRGTVRARRVVLATNGYTARLVPRLQGVVVPLRGQITMQRPGLNMPGSRNKTDRDAKGLDTTYSFIYDGGYEYMISRPPASKFGGDIVIGGGLRFADSRPNVPLGLCEFGTTDDTTLNPRVSAYLTGTTPRYFGKESHWGADDPDGRVRKEWTGIMGFTSDGYPLVGQMPEAKKEAPNEQKESTDGLFLCCAFQGNGMVFAWMCGKALAEMLQGRDNEELQKWFPPSFRTAEERLHKPFLGKQGAKVPK